MKIAAKIESDRLVVDVEVTNELDEPLYLKHWNLNWRGIVTVGPLARIEEKEQKNR